MLLSGLQLCVAQLPTCEETRFHVELCKTVDGTINYKTWRTRLENQRADRTFDESSYNSRAGTAFYQSQQIGANQRLTYDYRFFIFYSNIGQNLRKFANAYLKDERYRADDGSPVSTHFPLAPQMQQQNRGEHFSANTITQLDALIAMAKHFEIYSASISRQQLVNIRAEQQRARLRFIGEREKPVGSNIFSSTFYINTAAFT